ncbi:HAD-like domain-containing protein [Hypoxylon crocopeplum]|nr:HAD-like domain-containing protein [Hypoxylon crocopeplum]
MSAGRWRYSLEDRPYISPAPEHPFSKTKPTPEQRRLEERRKEMAKNVKIAPSAASGGVPDPTPEYLMTASVPPFQLPYARQLLVIVDLNGTMLYRPDRFRASAFIERPHARTFLTYLINTFNVIIWSSARDHNVRKMCGQLLTPQQIERVIIFGRGDFGLSAEDELLHVQCYKRLSRIWDKKVVQRKHPGRAAGERWSQANTILVDDSLEKARSEPYNLIQIPEFLGETKDESNVLPQVHDYINECARQANVSAYIRSRPFRVVPNWELGSTPPSEEMLDGHEETQKSSELVVIIPYGTVKARYVAL